MSETAFADDIKELGDKLVGLTLKKAKELSDYIKEEHGIEPAAGGGMMMAAPADAAPAAPVEQTEFDVVMSSFGENKLNVVKVVKSITGLSLMDAKKLVEALPAKIKEGASKDDAAKVKKELEEAGAAVELK
jgi:large subunit ribosomal protein L7/L12